MMANMFVRCHMNQTSMYFMYDVLGRSSWIAFSRVTMTRRAVPDPINLSLNPVSFGSINRVVYPKSQSISDGTKAMVIWFVYKRVKWILTIFFVDSFVFLTCFVMFPIRNWPTTFLHNHGQKSESNFYHATVASLGFWIHWFQELFTHTHLGKYMWKDSLT